MADIEGMNRLKLKFNETDDPDTRAIILAKLEKLKNWEHPRVTAKMSELRSRGKIPSPSS